MIDTYKTLFDILKKKKRHIIYPAIPFQMDFVAKITYTDSIEEIPINGNLLSVSISKNGNDKKNPDLISFEVSHGKGSMYLDYYPNGNYTDISYEGNGEEYSFHQIIDNNIPVRIVRSITKSIAK